MLTGACISRAGLNRTTAYATATWVLASEFPDIDVAYYLRGSVEAFAHHRGWTHTFMAAPVDAAVVVGGLYFWWWWRRRKTYIPLRGNVGHPHSRDPETRHPASLPGASQRPGRIADEPRWGLLLVYAVLAAFGHVLLDYVTAYGVRPFEPFSFQWFSWDI